MPLCDKVFSNMGRHINAYELENYLSMTDSEKDMISENDMAVIEIELDGQNPSYLPLRSISDGNKVPNDIGYYRSTKSPFSFCNFPKTDEEKYIYQPELNSGAIINRKNQKDMQQFLDETAREKSREKESLERYTANGAYIPPLLENDSAEMRGLKTCIILKEMDIDNYAERFGPNYPNDKRKIKDPDITSFLLKRYCTNFDLEVDIVFRDKNPDVANAMNKEVRVNMIPGNGNNVDIIDLK